MGDLSGYTLLGHQNISRLLVTSNADTYDEEESIEKDIKTLIKKYRDAKKLFTRFNDELSCVLSSALQCYEINKTTGSSINSDSFQSGIKNMIPDGHIFKAFPIQQTHKNPISIFEVIRSNAVGEEILNILGDQINYAVRVKIVTFPENIFAVWIIIGVHYIEI